MKESPILFSGPLVRALLAGSKTQTRRLIKPQPGPELGETPGAAWNAGFVDVKCRYGNRGDRLWVKENWTAGYARGCWGTIFQADGEFVQGKRQHPKGSHYNASDRPPGIKWRPSIHLPRWASRITLEVTEVRVERVNDITEEDAKAEGVEPLSCVAPEQQIISGEGRTQGTHPYTLAFAVLWDTINDEDGRRWVDRPWVWCVSFRRLP